MKLFDRSLAFLIAVSALGGCATTGAAPISTANCRREYDPAVQPRRTVEQQLGNSACTTTEPHLRAGEHLTAIRLMGNTSSSVRVGISFEQGVSPQAHVVCYHTFVGTRGATVYFVTPTVTQEFIIFPIHEGSFGGLSISYSDVRIPESVEIDGHRAATHVACSTENFASVVACAHLVDHASP